MSSGPFALTLVLTCHRGLKGPYCTLGSRIRETQLPEDTLSEGAAAQQFLPPCGEYGRMTIVPAGAARCVLQRARVNVYGDPERLRPAAGPHNELAQECYERV